jgi:hypothetical protein
MNNSLTAALLIDFIDTISGYAAKNQQNHVKGCL